MQKLNIYELQALQYSIDYVVGYLTDNSCSDPDCCGGPCYEHDDYIKDIEKLKEFGIEVDTKLPEGC